MKKELLLTALVSAVIGSTLSLVVVFASGPGIPYPDVAEDAFYRDSVYRMRDLGVITGYKNGNFGPNDYVTRGQIATMLDRYDKKLLNPEWLSVSGIYELQFVICKGGIDYNFEIEGAELAYNNICKDFPIN
jgi:hypothetical protein